MPRYRFSWSAFSDDFVVALADSFGREVDASKAREYLARKMARPKPTLVRDHKDAVLEWFDAHEASARDLFLRLKDAGLGPMQNPRSHRGYMKFIRETRNTKRFRAFVCEVMIAFGDMDRVEDEPVDGFVPRFTIVEADARVQDDRKAHDYQNEAWDRLTAHLAATEGAAFQGLLVMPTGSGKTFTTARWLAQHVLARGDRVLWLAHRTELLRHAASELIQVAPLTGRRLRVRIVAGEFCSSTQIHPEDDVIVASIASLARRPDIRDEVLADPRLFVVIDEAHHAPAKSYRDLVRELASRRSFRLLGLTATPTRTLERERPELRRMFADRILHHVSTRALVERGTLSRPRLVRVDTGLDAEADVTGADLEHLRRFHELSPEWANRLAHQAARNDVIVEHFLEFRERYGKTLVFAVNVEHASHLCARFRERGVRAQYVASHRPDGTNPGEPMQIIERFRSGDIDVLVNVAMVTEGVDVPDIQTVLLTRPTNSEILLRQMIGRALRGPEAGGTATAYLVSFEDHWTRFREWESPFDFVPDIAALEQAEPVAKTVSKTMPDAAEVESDEHQLSWETYRVLVRELRKLRADPRATLFDAVPVGWYVLEHDGGDGEPLRHVVPVHEHQLACWEACFDAAWSGQPADYTELETWFADCDAPQPSSRDIELAFETRRYGGERPRLLPLEARDASDPAALARRIWDENLGAREHSQLVEDAYGPLARAVYGGLPSFSRAVDEALHALKHGGVRPRKAVPAFELGERHLLTPGPAHDLDALFREVLERGAPLLERESLHHAGNVEWTTRTMKGWFGMAYYDAATPPGSGDIRMNVLLDSSEVPANVISYLLWHEYLHLYLQTGHTNGFRELEHKWPGYMEADRFLDTLRERFVVELDGLQEW